LEKGKLNMAEYTRDIVLQMAESQKWFSTSNKDDMKRRLDGLIEQLPDDYNTYLSIIKRLEDKKRFSSLNDMMDIIAGQIEEKPPTQNLLDLIIGTKRKMKSAQLSGLFATLFDSKGLGDTYESEKAANEVINKIAASVQLILRNTGNQIGNQTKAKTEILAAQLIELRDEVKQRINDFSEEARKINLDALAFNIPSYLDEWAFDEPDEVNQPDFIETKQKHILRVCAKTAPGVVLNVFSTGLMKVGDMTM
jgi:hypothetical protein